MKSAELNNVEIAYRDLGSGTPIVFLHAFPLNQSFWDEQVEELSSSFRVITLDCRGFGASKLNDDPSTMDVFAADLKALLDHLQVERAVLCGLSMGGYIAFSFVRRYSERVSGLILADTRAGKDTDEARQNRLKMAATAREKGSQAIADGMLPKLLSGDAHARKPEVVKRVRDMIEANSGEAIARALLGMAQRPDSTPLLSSIEVPTLIIVGEADELTPPKESQILASSISSSELVIIPGAGHLSNLESPEVFNKSVAPFLSRLQQVL